MKQFPGDSIRQAIPLILINEDNKFTLCSDGCKLFESQIEPFAVIIVTGLYRTGKSYLLNQLIGAKETFKVDPTTQACTRGIWATS